MTRTATGRRKKNPLPEYYLAPEGVDVGVATPWEELVEPYREAARERVQEMAGRWAKRNRRTDQRREYNQLLVLSQLGLATEEEEAEVWWRYCHARQTHTVFPEQN